MAENEETIAIRIKKIIAEKKLTINGLAEKLGITRVTLSSQINGNANIKTYQKIADALDVEMWQLFPPRKSKDMEDGIASDFMALIKFRGQLYEADSIPNLEALIAKWKDDRATELRSNE